MENRSKENGLNLSALSTERLEKKLRIELYRDIDSKFAKEIQGELDSRAGERTEKEPEKKQKEKSK